jgi:hypothetical protein
MTFIVFLVPLESLQQVGVYQGGLIMSKPTIEDLLNIENFCHWKFIEIKINV